MFPNVQQFIARTTLLTWACACENVLKFMPVVGLLGSRRQALFRSSPEEAERKRHLQSHAGPQAPRNRAGVLWHSVAFYCKYFLKRITRLHTEGGLLLTFRRYFHPDVCVCVWCGGVLVEWFLNRQNAFLLKNPSALTLEKTFGAPWIATLLFHQWLFPSWLRSRSWRTTDHQ